jgi:hypothetical protein
MTPGAVWFLTSWLPALILWGLWQRARCQRDEARCALRATTKALQAETTHSYGLERQLQAQRLVDHLSPVYVAQQIARKEVN